MEINTYCATHPNLVSSYESSLETITAWVTHDRLTKDFLEERICVEHCRSWREVEQAGFKSFQMRHV